MALRVLIAAGGTGGHIFPGLAVAREFQRRDPAVEIRFVGTARGLESRIVPAEGFKLELIPVGALKGVSVFERMRSLAGLPVSFVGALGVIRRFHPQLVIGIGGYSSGPTLLTAAMKRIPTMVIEPNAMPGFTNRVLGRFVDAAGVSFEESLRYFKGRGAVTGNPVRGEFARLQKKERTGKLNLLIFGGSQGAHSINVAMTGALPLIPAGKESLDITHQTGERDFEEVKRAYAELGFLNADVRPFIKDMAHHFEQADVVVSRSGATTVAEIAAAGKAAIFVPFPFATDDHQRKNAEAFQRNGAGRMILQADLTPERLASEISELIAHPEEIIGMEEASKKLGRPNAAESAVDLAMKLVTNRFIV
ncbi:MAG TPA: undecaprenyldiphospho-muramoylpentapeptide beta-N-acetylglucosaminyltransferase [Blastocatellia bacterium]|nr:undecaprenyldiphospho-muramoylpentapeptide beta-N-acetylglucosaminyltransferase [Blastocatellia bacterium]